MMKKCYRITCILLIVILLLFNLISSVAAHVIPGHEWKIDQSTGKPRRNLRIWCGSEVTQQWKDWMEEATENWEGTNSGWTFEFVDDIQNSDITFHTATIPPESNGSAVAGRYQPDFDGQTGEVIGATITMNNDSAIPWGTQGDDSINPVKVLKHELGHSMGLDHSFFGNLMDEEIFPGDHYLTPNGDDISQAKESCQFNREDVEVIPSGDSQVCLDSGLVSLTLDEDEYLSIIDSYGTELNFRPLFGVVVPEPLAVSDGFERVISAAGIFPQEINFNQEVVLTFTCDDDYINGLKPVGELHYYVLPQLDINQMIPVQYIKGDGDDSTGSWEEIDIDLIFDSVNMTATFSVSTGGIYGIAAPAMNLATAHQVDIFSDIVLDGNNDNIDTTAWTSLIELNAMGIYNGYPDGTAKPNNTLTRIEFVTLAVRMAGGEQEANTLMDQRPPFIDDIPKWAWGYLNYAISANLVKGYPDGTFKPQKEVTGIEAVAMIIRLFGEYEEEMALAQPWPIGYLDVGEQLDILNSLDTYTNSPSDIWAARPINRAEMAVLALSALWNSKRFTDLGTVANESSLSDQNTWWRQTVKIAAVTENYRQVLLFKPIILYNEEEISRLNVSEELVTTSQTPILPILPGDTVIVLGHDKTIKALFR